ncbi:MAG TPA: branched-chain amino acid ABC transporter permease [Segeticoccus sp.]|uniref:branched-chain amino acid ABC transporter permease n=1 Tax=Segeticoccus sp. TaxID=2706531 RepID=UPI002D7FC786|nr:branched-chain amino acid ABC transporter permease [Segeticoccus sp.]HET8599350.1 branched-chain amino acid ABC transporter permease [Segeticoccus sp.]
MRARLIAIVVASFLALFLAPALPSLATPVADGGQSVNGTLRSPAGSGVPGVKVTVTRHGSPTGSATTDQTGHWKIAVPEPGTYAVSLDVGSLPTSLQLRTKGGQTLPSVTVRPGEDRTVLFPLIPSSQKQEQPTSAATSSSGSSSSASPPSTSAEGGTTSGGAVDQAAADRADQATGFTSRFLQLVVEGIKLGAIIAITAVGLSLVFGTTRLINFAHGELVTIGAFAALWFSTTGFHLPLVLATVIAVAIGALVGGAMEAGLWRPMRARGAGLIQMFIISIGLSLLLRHVLLVIFGSRRSQYAQYTVQDALNLGPVSITPRDLVVTLLSLAVLLGVAFALQRTRMGKATRAIADNKDLAEASGIDVNRVILLIWMVGGGLAALGGVFYGLTQAVYWDMGFNLLLLMFAGVILGGLGSAYGAMIGSFAVGLVAQLSTLWFEPELQNAWALLALIVVLLFRPQGILGRAERAG